MLENGKVAGGDITIKFDFYKLVDQLVTSLIDKTNESNLTIGTVMNRDHQTVNVNLTT